MLDKMDPLDELNKYRKAYGNLKECITKGKAISAVFHLDGTCFKFHKPDVVAGCHANGLMEDAAYAKFQEGRKSYLTKHLKLCKDFKMNICKKCDQKYYVAGNKDGACWSGDKGPHMAAYDFAKDPENVLNCAL
jgi:hypothetical protein